MIKNIGKTDKMVRLGAAALILVLYFVGRDAEAGISTTGIILLIVAIILAATSLMNFCPLYSIFKIKTNKNEQ